MAVGGYGARTSAQFDGVGALKFIAQIGAFNDRLHLSIGKTKKDGNHKPLIHVEYTGGWKKQIILPNKTNFSSTICPNSEKLNIVSSWFNVKCLPERHH